MGFLKLIEKKNVPDELPALITEEIQKKETKPENVIEVSQEVQVKTIPQEKDNKNTFQEPISLPEKQVKPDENLAKENSENKDNSIKNEAQIKSISEENFPKVIKDSFFIKLQENLNKEMDSLNKLEEWYNTQLLPEDTLSEMKRYWEKQKLSSMIQVIGKDFQDKITQKISLLQELEKTWQGIYFNLIEKEEQIKEQEKELKKMLAEFIGFCKKRNEKEERKTPKKRKK